MKRINLLLITFMVSAAALGQDPSFDPRSWKRSYAGPPTQVMVLGSVHLSEVAVPVSSEMLTPLLDKLATFSPTIITYEGLSGEQCDTLQRYPGKYPGTFDQYCWGTEEAEKATGLSVPAALAEIDKTLGSWAPAPTAAQRRRLASLFLAANDRPSAQVQWQRLSANERVVGEGIDEALLKILARADAKPNETYMVGVALAIRLGLERVYAVDDHTADSIEYLAGSGFEESIQKVWRDSSNPVAKEINRRKNSLVTGVDLLALYRYVNEPAMQRALINADMAAALKQETPALYGRQYVAWWETRNLRMVANIRAAFGNYPGARVLNIVGSSHKPYYDAYLNMMHEVKLVDVETILK
jgi:Family of unknown function (DUF5694)